MAKRDTSSKIPKQANETLVAIGESIRKARLSRNLSQTQLAEKTMVSRDCIRRMEAGDAGVSLGNVVMALWSLGLHAQFSQSIAPENDGFGALMRLRENRRRGRPETEDEHDKGLDF